MRIQRYIMLVDTRGEQEPRQNKTERESPKMENGLLHYLGQINIKVIK
jgi:hypothetical protein